MMIHAILNIPKITPFAAAAPTIRAGIPKTTSARITAVNIPHIAENQTRFLSATRTKKSVNTGRAATNVESGQEPNGS